MFEAQFVDLVTSLLDMRHEDLNCSDSRTAAFLLVHSSNAAIHQALVDPSVELDDVRAELERMFRAYLS